MIPRFPLGMLALMVAVAPVFSADDGKSDKDDRVNGQTRSDDQPTSPSSHISSAIFAKVREYKPPPKVELPEGMTEEDIVIMEQVTVRERRQPRVKGWDMLTDKGKVDYLKTKYRGATIPGMRMSDLAYNYGKLMALEDIRVENLKALQDLVDAQRAAGTGGQEMKELNALMQEAQLLPNDWKAESMDKSANNGRR